MAIAESIEKDKKKEIELRSKGLEIRETLGRKKKMDSDKKQRQEAEMEEMIQLISAKQ